VTAGSRGADLSLRARVDAPRDTYDFETATGVCSPDDFRDAELALVEALWDRAVGCLLVVEANYGVPGVLLADASQSVVMTEASARGAGLCATNAERNAVLDRVSVANVAEPRELDDLPDGGFDAAAYAPKPYTPLDVAKERLVAALDCLDPGGQLFVAARERTGLGRFADALATAGGEVQTVAEHGDCEVLAATRPDAGAVTLSCSQPSSLSCSQPSSLSCSQPSSLSFVEPRAVSATVDGTALSLVAVPGVFSATELDHGTRLLLETASVTHGDAVLDLCCGYGAAGVWAAKTADCSVTLTDDDRVATRCAECSVAASGVDATVLTADGTSGLGGAKFDTILCNPPTHAGDDVLRELFDGARRVLASDGTLWVVHHRELDLQPQLSGFGAVDVAAEGEEHVVLAVVA